MAIIFSQGKPFRTSFLKNVKFSITVFAMISLTIYMFSHHSYNLSSRFMQLVDFPASEKLYFLQMFCLFGFANIFLCHSMENIINNEQSVIYLKFRKFLKLDKLMNKIDIYYDNQRVLQHSKDQNEAKNSVNSQSDTSFRSFRHKQYSENSIRSGRKSHNSDIEQGEIYSDGSEEHRDRR